jgi:WD40 repeat protein
MIDATDPAHPTVTTVPASTPDGAFSVGDVAVSADGHRVYTTDASTQSVTIWDTSGAAPVVVGSVALGPRNPDEIVASKDGNRLYVWSYGQTVSVIDTSGTTPKLIGTVAIPLYSYNLQVSEDGSHAVLDGGNGRVVVISDPTVTTTTV